MTKIPSEVEALKTLKWVKSAKRVRNGYTIVTVGGMLTARVTTGLIIREVFGSELVGKGKVLKKPMLVPLPSYKVHLRTYGNTIRLVEKPKVKDGLFVAYPTSYYPRPIREWRNNFDPCMGEYGRDYDEAITFFERANVMAMLLQMGKPDSDSFKGLGKFAYYNGLLPEEYIERV